ncbi:nose resistant to fluoxetine protein 6-like isoform 2-T2 [Glossina fuscipes fuscipes]
MLKKSFKIYKHSVVVRLTLLSLIGLILPLSTEAIQTVTGVAQISTNVSGSSYLTQNQFQLFENSLKYLKDELCRRDLNAILRGIMDNEQWAISMYDAAVQQANGIESGIFYHFGHYDQCLKLTQKQQQQQQQQQQLQQEQGQEHSNNNSITIVAKYCLVDVFIDELIVQNTGSRKIRQDSSPQNQTTELLIRWGACMPASCGPNDIAIFAKHALQRKVNVNDNMCQLYKPELHITAGMYTYAFVICFFIFVTVLSTLYHTYLLSSKSDKDIVDVEKSSAKPQRTLDEILLTFSLIENCSKLFQASKDQLSLNCINGIKSLAMLLILAGHVLIFIYGSPVYNVEFLSQNIKSPIFAFLPNSMLVVDVFLLLSGFLFCRILLVELRRRHGQINVLVLYVARWIRLTPAYLVTIGFYMTWFPSLGDGPLWQQRIEREQERCISSWFLNILYINNYFNVDKLCMFQSWYLAVDSQLFFLSPIIIYLLNRSRKYGIILLSITAVITSIIPFIISYTKNLSPTLMIYSNEAEDINSSYYYKNFYIKTHMRASAYVIGLFVGYLVHEMQARNIKLPSPIVRFLWLLATVIGSSCMLTISRFYAYPYNRLESSIYAGFHKIGWNMSVAWLILAASTGHAGWIQKFLCHRIFAPISRLTYCAYLSNGIVELYYSSSSKTAPQISYIRVLCPCFY